MAKTFKDEDTAADIMEFTRCSICKDVECHKVKGFDAKKWNGLKSDIMFTPLSIKFKPGSRICY